jgi:hypothetical protein
LKYIVGKGISFIFNRRVYETGDEIDESYFGDPKPLIDSGKLLPVSAAGTEPPIPGTEPPPADNGTKTKNSRGK